MDPSNMSLLQILKEDYTATTGRTASGLLVLPVEIRDRIFDYLAGENSNMVADVSMQPPRKQGRAPQLQNCFPRLVSNFRPLLQMPHFSQDVSAYLSSQVMFYGKHSNGVTGMPQVLGPGICQLIQNFELRLEWHIKNKHQQKWWQLFECLANNLPNLEVVKFCTEFQHDSRTYPEREGGDPEGTITRPDQEMRCLMRIMSWLVIRLPKFGTNARVIWPAHSGERFGFKREGQRTQHLILEKFRTVRVWKSRSKVVVLPRPEDNVSDEEARSMIKTVYDEVLDTKLLRRQKWTAWQNSNFNMQRFVIQPEEGQSRNSILTSEVVHDDDRFFARLDERGYRSPQTFRQRDWYRSSGFEVDGLIQQAFRYKADTVARQEETQRRRAEGFHRGARTQDRGRGRAPVRGNHQGRGSHGASGNAHIGPLTHNFSDLDLSYGDNNTRGGWGRGRGFRGRVPRGSANRGGRGGAGANGS